MRARVVREHFECNLVAAGVTADLLVQLRIVQCKAAVRSKHLMPKGGGDSRWMRVGEKGCACVLVCECVSACVSECACV